MPFLDDTSRREAELFASLFRINPFGDERQKLEQALLQDAWKNPLDDDDAAEANQLALEHSARVLTSKLLHRLHEGYAARGDDADLYREVALVSLYDAFAVRFDGLTDGTKGAVPFYGDFIERFEELFRTEPRTRPEETPGHLFALFFQLRRAFHHVHRFLLGSSTAARALRAEVWRSIFTHDIARYRRGLFERLGEVPTMITGPSGTGKELVARAVALSRYVPFDEKRRAFDWDPSRAFLAVNLSALSPTLLESELFGHKKGAFTDAREDREGWLSACPNYGAVFLDEIGDVDAGIQVKLLRVLETRSFSPLGSTDVEPFVGKLIAATHKFLDDEMRAGRFREDLAYRLQADVLHTPSLQTRLQQDPAELDLLVGFLAAQAAGDDEAEGLKADVLQALATLPDGYPWPGNVRELLQAVRQVMVHGTYRPPLRASSSSSSSSGPQWLKDLRAGTLDVDTVVDHYVFQVYEQVGSYDGAGRVLGLDRRTVKSRVKRAMEASTS